MRSLLKAAFVLSMVVSTMASFATAQDAKGKGKKKNAGETMVVDQAFAIPKEITLTDDQKAKVETLKKELSPKLTDLLKKMNEGLTADQQKARREAMAKAKEDGKKPKEMQEEGEKALNLTDEQKKIRSETQPEVQKLQASIKEQIHALLTDEQKAHYKLPGKRKK